MLGQSPHRRANTIYFIVTCVVLGGIALVIMGAIAVASFRPTGTSLGSESEEAKHMLDKT